MNHVFSWSGGFDSTWMVLDFLRGVKNGTGEFDRENDSILLCSVEHRNTGFRKIQRERNARALILHYIKKEYTDITINVVSIDVEINCTEPLLPGPGLSQPILWTSNIIPYLHEGDKLYFGYIRGDDSISYISSIQGLVKIYSSLKGFHYTDAIKIEFPILHLGKADILRYLIINFPEVMEYCTSCENEHSSSDHCKRCIPCKHLKAAYLELTLSDILSVATYGLVKLREDFGINVAVEIGGQGNKIHSYDDRKFYEDTDTIVDASEPTVGIGLTFTDKDNTDDIQVRG